MVTEPRRQGWQLPGSHREGDVDEPSGPRSGSHDAREERDASSRPPDGSQRQQHPQMLRGSVSGQVSGVSESIVHVGQHPEPVATFRLERHDPHAGRLAVATVRLNGPDALGFVSAGDWVEAVGKRDGAHLVARHCINHTTHSVFKLSALRQHRIVIAVVVFVVLASAMLGGFAYLASRGQDDFNRRVEQQRRQFDDQTRRSRSEFIDRCIASGAPRDFCEGRS